jgi:hypothetical protein
MVNPVEQFTAPGKYYYDLAMELIEAELKNPAPLYNHSKIQLEKSCMSKDNPYYSSSKMREK